MMKTQEELLDLHGADYVERFQCIHTSTFRIDRMLSYIRLPEAADIVDFGCGDGLLMQVFSPRVRQYVGVDFSQNFIAAAERRRQELGVVNADFECADIIDFCARNPQRFDVGFALDFSEHVYDEAWLQLLKSMRRAIKSGGRFYLHTPNAEFLIERMKQRDFILKQFPEHIAVRSPEENAALLAQAGFRVESIRLLPHYNILRFLHPFSFLPGLRRLFKARIFIEAVA